MTHPQPIPAAQGMGCSDRPGWVGCPALLPGEEVGGRQFPSSWGGGGQQGRTRGPALALTSDNGWAFGNRGEVAPKGLDCWGTGVTLIREEAEPARQWGDPQGS